jgi:hypothetical protein
MMRSQLGELVLRMVLTACPVPRKTRTYRTARALHKVKGPPKRCNIPDKNHLKKEYTAVYSNLVNWYV